MILLIDNYDSFVYNLARYFQRLGQETCVARNDAIDVAAIRTVRPRAVVLSPGPCTPDEAGVSLEVVRRLHGEFPMLGICLGHQVIVQALGGVIIRTAPVHGRTSEVIHDGSGVFAGLPNPLIACRYHSLAADERKMPDELTVSARTADGTIMAVQHRRLPVVGVQFHPESILTEHGLALLASFLQSSQISLSLQSTKSAVELEKSPERGLSTSLVPVPY